MVRSRSLAKAVVPKVRLSTQGYLRLAVMQALLVLPQQNYAAPAFGSAAWFAQTQTATPNAATANQTANNTVVVGGVATPQQAVKQADRSLESLRRTLNTVMQTQRLQQMAAKKFTG